jgi:hypothetical protein
MTRRSRAGSTTVTSIALTDPGRGEVSISTILSEIGRKTATLGEVAVQPYVDFYQRSIVEPFRAGVNFLAQSPLGDPGLYASLQGLGPPGALAASAGSFVARGLRSVAAIALPEKEIARGGLSAGQQLAVNREAGAAWGQATKARLESKPLDIGEEVTLKTDSGISTRIDFITRDPLTGKMECIECKASPSAPLTSNQKLAIPEIERSGATISGAGKPGFPGGTKIPPTKVQILRGPQRDAP